MVGPGKKIGPEAALMFFGGGGQLSFLSDALLSATCNNTPFISILDIKGHKKKKCPLHERLGIPILYEGHIRLINGLKLDSI